MRQTETKTPKLTLVVLLLCFLLWGVVHKLSGEIGGLMTTLFPEYNGAGETVALAFFGGYCAAALPAAFFNWHVTYKAGTMLGLFILVFSCIALYPASLSGDLEAFAWVYFMQAFGLCFIEMAANTYALTMGDAPKALYRLSLSQCFNSLGWLAGAFIFVFQVQPDIMGFDATQRLHMSPALVQSCRESDLLVILQPYIWLAVLGVIVMVLIGSSHFSVHRDWDGWQGGSLGGAITILLFNPRYIMGCLSMFLYIGVQTCCFASLYSFAHDAFASSDGVSSLQANIFARDVARWGFVLFFVGRIIFACRVRSSLDSLGLLRIVSILSALCLALVAVSPGLLGVFALMAVSLCMSVMFPIIFANSLRGYNAAVVKMGAAGHMLAFSGGVALPAIQRFWAESDSFLFLKPAAASFLVPAVACLFIALFAHLSRKELVM